MTYVSTVISGNALYVSTYHKHNIFSACVYFMVMCEALRGKRSQLIRSQFVDYVNGK